MPASKIFAGSRLRRLRLKLGLSQAAFAQSLGLSASYLNLMERDQRPLTAQVVLKLSADGIDVSALAANESAQSLLQPLREMTADPLVQGEVPPGNELDEAVSAAPNVIAAALKLYSAYRETLKRLSSLPQALPVASDSRAQHWLDARDNEDIEALAEDIWSEITPKDDIFAGLKLRLRSSLGIDTRIYPESIMEADRSRYDRHAQRLMISERLSLEARIYEAAHLAARLEGRALLDALPFAENSDQRRTVKAALLDHLSLALLCPRGRFSTSAEDLKWDISVLARRFSVSFGDAMKRIALLNRDVGYLCVEPTGHVTTRIGNLHFYLPQDATLCAQLPMFDDETAMRIAEMKQSDGRSFVVISMRVRGRAHALLFAQDDFAKTIYAGKTEQRPLGAACRLCDIKACAKRSAAPANRPALENDYARRMTAFEPV